MWTEAGQLGDGMPGRSCYLMEDAECGDISPDTWREPPLPDDSDLRERRLQLKMRLFEVFFGTEEERRVYGRKCFPFQELPPDHLEKMSSEIRAAYDADLAYARDPRSGRIVRPYIPQDIATPLAEA